MRICDWRSDVCSSDLHGAFRRLNIQPVVIVAARRVSATDRAADRPAETGCLRGRGAGRLDDRRARDWCRVQLRNAGLRRIEQGRDQEVRAGLQRRSEEHTSELQSLMRISYAVFCLKKK